MRSSLILSLLLFLLLGFASSAEAKSLTASPSQSLQSIIDQANDHDVIQVEAGLYKGDIVINKPLQLIGKPGAIIQGDRDGNVITVNAEQVTLKNLIVTGSGSSSAGIYITKNSSIVENNQIHDVFHGVQIYQGHGSIIRENQISSFDQEGFLGFGIFFNESTQNQVLNNQVKHVQDGIYFSFSGTSVIHGNTITDARYGIHTMDSDELQFTENRSINNMTGAMVMLSAYLDIRNNQFLHNKGPTGAGIFLFDCRNVSVSENEIVDNSRGIYFENNYDSAFFKNTIAGNNTGIEIKQVSKNNAVFQNNFIANVRQIRNLGENSNLFDDTKQGNYWDDYRGIDVNKDGVGELHYRSGDMFYGMMEKKPELQLFFESPAVVMLNSIKKFVPENDKQDIEDQYPLLQPLSLKAVKDESKQAFPITFTAFILILFVSSIRIYYKGLKSS